MYVFLQGHGQEIRDPRIRRIMLPRELACTFLTPRGKFDLHFLKENIKIHGPTHDYKINFSNINK